MEDCFENENGKIVKDPEVIVSHAVLDFFGIVGMGNWSVKVIKRDNVFRGIIIRKMKRE